MGNPNARRPQKLSVTKPTSSPVSSKSSGISPKTLTKNTAKKIAAAGNMIVDGDAMFPTEGTEVKEEPKQRPGLGFKSMKTNSLPVNEYFPSQEDLKKVKEEIEKKSAATAKALSAKATHFVPGVSQYNKTPTRKPGQPGVFGSTRHNKYRPKPRPGVAEIHGVIAEMKLQPFPPWTPNTHGKHISDGSTATQLSSGGVSLVTAVTTPQPLRLVDVRVNKEKKDIIITANSIYRNRVNNCVQTLDSRGNTVINLPTDLNPGSVLNEIAALDDDAKKLFWETNAVQIEVDLCSLPAAVSYEKKDSANVVAGQSKTDDKRKGKEVAIYAPSVMDQIARLGPEFWEYTTNVHVEIQFPAPRDGSLAPRAHTHTNKEGMWIYPDHSISVGTLGFVILEELVEILDHIISMKSLEVILHNVHASTTVPFTLEQLYYALPFYDLHFTEWKLKWRGNNIPEPFEVGHFPLILLDKERNKWLWEKKKAAQEMERQECLKQEWLGQVVKTTPSEIGPNPRLPLFKPAPKPAPKVSAEPTAKLITNLPVKNLAKSVEKHRSTLQQGL